MASIRIPFPEKDEPGTVALTGSRITIGRLAFNTVQIIDRTMSGFHAELILEDGHYRLHDRGSTNGTFVNGELVTDFHLREACKISFGTVECDFDPVAASATDTEAVPTRGEINAVRQENVELRGTLVAVREELAALVGLKPAGELVEAVSREDFAKVLDEREALKEAQLRQEHEIARLKSEVAILRRDRENLQKAWDATKAELARTQPRIEAVAVVDVPVAVSPNPVPAVAVPIAAQTAPVPVVKMPPAPALPKPVLPMPAAPSVRPAAAVTAPSQAPKPTTKLVTPLAPPTGQPFPAPKPAGSPTKLIPAPTMVAQATQANSSGIRPFPKAMPAVSPGAPKVAPPPAVLPRPAASVLQPRTSVRPVPAQPAGPKGTQKIS